MIQAMKQIPEGDGTMFDNTVILRWNELARGNAHDFENMPYLLAGRCGGYFNTGRHLQYGGASHNDLLVSLLNAMDVPDQTFGVPEYCTGPLPRPPPDAQPMGSPQHSSDFTGGQEIRK